MINAKKLTPNGHKINRLNAEPAWNLGPVSTWQDLKSADHLAQFYETDSFLLDSLTEFVRSGINARETVVVVATQHHREGLERQLLNSGVDLVEAIASGRYLPMDAAGVLDRFMVDGMPDHRLFKEVLSPVIERRLDSRPLRVFGEMVALLWESENRSAAIKLEKLWNELLQEHRFSLYCAYPIRGFGERALAQPLLDICAAHSQVIPAESYTGLSTDDSRLRAILELQQKARALEAEIVERKRAEETLQALKEELERQVIREQIARGDAEYANRMKDEFLATVSHELRTPMNAIIGWTHMLRNGSLDQTTSTRALETIDRNAKAQAQLVEDILDVARVITGKLRLNMGPVDIAAVINAAVDSVHLAAETKGIKLVVTLDPSSRHITGDASRLQQVVWNLLSNAIKFTPSGGKVEVDLSQVDSSIQIKVMDSGLGIKREFLPFIFDRFRQADGTTTRQHGGLGLGLAIVRHLIELHGGTVYAQSDGPDHGSTFIIKLPTANRSRPATDEHPHESLYVHEAIQQQETKTLQSLEQVRILLVDDNVDTLQVLTVMLREQRANVEAVTSTANALEVLEWFNPDVVVSDLAMPGEDGYSLIRKIRDSEHHDIPAVALTAYVRVEDRARALSNGFSMFVAKPVEPNELITAISNLVHSEK